MKSRIMRGLITRGDYSIMHRANNWVAAALGAFLRFGAPRAGGDGWLWLCDGTRDPILRRRSAIRALGAAGLSSVLSILLFLWLKRLTGRRRPCHIEPHCWAKLLPPDKFSFSLRPYHDGFPLSPFRSRCSIRT